MDKTHAFGVRDTGSNPLWDTNVSLSKTLKGIVHFKINFWYVLAYLKGIQDVGVFVSTAFSILTVFGQTVVVCQSYTGGEGGPQSVHLKKHAQRSPN